MTRIVILMDNQNVIRINDLKTQAARCQGELENFIEKAMLERAQEARTTRCAEERQSWEADPPNGLKWLENGS